MKHYLGIDLGGTNIAVGVVDEEARLLRKMSAPTPKNVPCCQLAEAIADLCRRLMEDMALSAEEVAGVGLGSPGQIDMDNGVIVFAGNLGLRNAPIVEELSKRLGMHTVVLNDADAAAYGEVAAGAARGAASAVTITLGTGVGCGVVLPGGVIRPGEGGHMVIVYDGEPCTCGRKGCFEAYASATALIRQTKIAMVKAPQSRLWEICGGELENVTGKTLFDALALGDATAKEVFDAYVHYVACGITNIVNLVQPEMVCVGGGISGAGEVLLAPLRKLVQADQFPMGDGRVTRIEVCQLGNDAGIIGAALFARR